MSNENIETDDTSYIDSDFDSEIEDYEEINNLDFISITSRRLIRHRTITYLDRPYVIVIPFYVLDPDGYVANIESDLLTLEHENKNQQYF